MLESLFYPQTVAVIGASRERGKVGHEVVANLLNGGFTGTIVPVNPKAADVLGIKCYPDLASYPGTVDLAAIVVPTKFVQAAVQSATEAGAKGIIVITAGFKEVGPEGAALEREIAEQCRANSARLVGPNCIGLINTNNKMNATFAPQMPPPGKISVISQSGALCVAILDMACHRRMGIKQIGEVEAKEILRAYDFNILPAGLAETSAQAVEIAERIGYPVVLKISSPDIIHKSDFGGARINLANAEQVRDAFDLMMLRVQRRAPNARIRGGYVEKMGTRGREVILGMTRDPAFGPMLMFGLGGIFVEVMKDVTFYLAPITAEEAMQMLKNTRSYALLQGARGQAPVDMEAIAVSLQRISQLVTDYPQISELDINPFIVGEVGTSCAVPTTLVSALTRRGPELVDTELVHLLTFGEAPYATPEMRRYFRVNSFDVLVSSQEPRHEVSPTEPSEEARQIAEHIAALVEDGSTVEFGIGRIPQALMKLLTHKRDLGIHTEMLTDGIVDLVESGAVTGERKKIDHGKIVASFCLGSRKLYDYIDGNPLFSFHPTEYVNDPSIIRQQPKMVAINTALEIDLTGQVCADSLGEKFYSGVGGQVDFNRGAGKANGGRAIIALPSTARNATVSRIVTHLTEGAGVVTSRAGVHYVVTEHGVAYLHGKSIQERALALISIAHPKFRAQLLREAIQSKFLPADLVDKENKLAGSPRELRTTMLLKDGTQLFFRAIHPTDEPRIRTLFYNLSQETIYYRFLRTMQAIPRKEILDMTYIDPRTEVAILATVPEAYGEDVVAIGRYYLDPKTNRAEVAFVVQDKWQRRGIGTFMLNHLIKVARRSGISGFTAEVLRSNRPMQAVFNRANCKVRSRLQDDVYHYDFDFE